MLQHLFRRGHLYDLAAFQEDDDVCQLQGLAHVMADENDGLAQLLLDVLHLVLQDLPGHGVQGGERLIHQYDRGRGRQGAKHADALLLATGQLGGVFVGIGLHVHHFQKIADDLVAALFFVFQQSWHHADVLGHGHVGEQADLLDDIADVAAQLHLVLGADILSVDADRTAVRLQQAVDHLHRGGLAAAGRTDQHHELSIRDGEVQVFEDGRFAVAFANMFKLDHVSSFAVIRL